MQRRLFTFAAFAMSLTTASVVLAGGEATPVWRSLERNESGGVRCHF
jgi:hypothetical protein